MKRLQEPKENIDINVQQSSSIKNHSFTENGFVRLSAGNHTIKNKKLKSNTLDLTPALIPQRPYPIKVPLGESNSNSNLRRISSDLNLANELQEPASPRDYEFAESPTDLGDDVVIRILGYWRPNIYMSPLWRVFLDPPKPLIDLLRGGDSKSIYFRENIRAFNMMFSFTSMGGKVDFSINQGRGLYVFRLHGQNYHRIGSLMPESGEHPKFAQLYIYDTDNEAKNRIKSFGSHTSSKKANPYDVEIVDELKKMIDENNPQAKAFRIARDRFDSDNSPSVHLRIIGRRGKDGRRYNLPTASEVAALIIGDLDNSFDNRDITSKKTLICNSVFGSYLAMYDSKSC